MKNLDIEENPLNKNSCRKISSPILIISYYIILVTSSLGLHNIIKAVWICSVFCEIMPFADKSATLLAATFASVLVEKSAVADSPKVTFTLDPQSALTLSTVGMHLDENERHIHCSGCGFTSSVHLDIRNICTTHYKKSPKCPNNKDIKKHVLSKMLTTYFTDWANEGAVDIDGLLLENTTDERAMDVSETQDIEEAEVFFYESSQIPKNPEERSKLADFKTVNSDITKTVIADGLADDCTGMCQVLMITILFRHLFYARVLRQFCRQF